METLKLKNLEKEFRNLTGLNYDFSKDYIMTCKPFLEYISTKENRPKEVHNRFFVGLVNKKFEVNKDAVAAFYTNAAKIGETFNYQEKKAIQEAFDTSDKEYLIRILKKKQLNDEWISYLSESFNPAHINVTLKKLKEEAENPSKLRIEQAGRNIGNEIAESLFSAFIWTSIEDKDAHGYFDPSFSSKEYASSFWEQLQITNPHLFNRKDSLHIVRFDKNLNQKLTDLDLRHSFLTGLVKNFYEKINNHGFFAVLIDSHEHQDRFVEWEICADLIFIGEKFKEGSLEKGYFKPERIKEETTAHISTISKKANFHLVNEGFTYRDTFVISSDKIGVDKILVLFQKNDRDETPIPCPSCRSINVQGNSYSSLGVRSWECDNLLCPDRTKYNRGKRYSFKALMMQEAIQNENNLIPKEIVKLWRRDVVKNVTDSDILKMLVHFYSMFEDTVHLHNWTLDNDKFLGRNIRSHVLHFDQYVDSSFFKCTSFIHRYITPISVNPSNSQIKNLGDDTFQVFNGDAFDILNQFKQNSFDAAITSPPYYNAREYSQWPNIYTYLHDMYKIAHGVFNTLKPGAFYLYNIFDYFDNENTVAHSAMGQKRMILSAYTVDLFRRLGFQLVGNITWDKGDIEGKRGFNSGNFSPFYQSPFNCWEHILVFKKPGNVEDRKTLDQIKENIKNIFECKPVMKIFKGKNTYGHTAPYPNNLPRLLLSALKRGSIVVDPFSGSMTTGRVAEEEGHKSVNIELSKEYCDLGLSMRENKLNFYEPNYNLEVESIS